MFANEDPDEFNARIETLTRALDASPDAEARRLAAELVGLVLELHGAGLRRLLRVAADGPSNLRERLLADPVIAGLLALHDLDTPEGMSETSRGTPALDGPLLQIRRRGPEPVARQGHSHQNSRCELCDAPLGATHSHSVDLVSRQLACCCRACWLLAEAPGSTGPRRAVPDRYVAGPALRLTDAQWDALQVPVATAFFMFNSTIGRTIAFYPSPAGATESALPLAAWHDVERSNSWVRTAAPDVEAILVRRTPDAAGYEAFIVPIDACYDLVGRIRTQWRGFDGGDDVRAAIDRFFAGVAARCEGAAETAAGRS